MHTFNASSGKRIFFKTPVLRALLDVHKACVNERMLNMRYSIHALPCPKRTFNVSFKNACLSYVAHSSKGRWFGAFIS